MLNKMKLLTMFVIVSAMVLLTACEGDFELEKATVMNKYTDKECERCYQNYWVTTETVEGSSYTFEVLESYYNLVSEGSIISVDYSGSSKLGVITPYEGVTKNE